MGRLKNTLRICLVCCLLVGKLFNIAFCGRVQADERIRELAVYLPENINTISIIRLKRPSASQNQSNENWSRLLKEHFGDDRAGFLAWGETLLVGSLFHPSVPEEAWATGVMHLPKKISINDIAKEQNASIDSLAGSPVLKTITGNYLVKFPADVIGLYRPGLRQDTAAWITSATKKKTISIQPYLQEAIDKQGDIILSLNLEHFLDPKLVKSKLEEDKRFDRHQKLVGQIVPLIAGLRGVTLSATTDEATECLITIDFSSKVGPSAGVIKTLFLSVLQDAGATIEEFSSAKVVASGNSVKLRCQLSEESMYRILSLVASPNISTDSDAHESPRSTAASDNGKATVDNEAGPSEKNRASKRYYEAVSKKIANLQKANRNAKNYKNTIAWHENFARNIENLSPRNVEREFLVFGQRTAKRFRALASSLRGQEVKVNLQEKTLTYQTDYDPGWATANWWGGAGYRAPSLNVQSNLEEVRTGIASEELKGYEERQKIWDLLLEDQEEMQNRLESLK